MNKIGFFDNAAGERSWTRLFHSFLFIFILGMWGAESWSAGGITTLDPTVLALLGGSLTGSGINKWIEANSSSEKSRFIRGIMAKVKK